MTPDEERLFRMIELDLDTIARTLAVGIIGSAAANNSEERTKTMHNVNQILQDHARIRDEYLRRER